MKIIITAIVFILILISGCKDNKHTNTYIVITAGRCGGGEGFFAGNRRCGVKVKRGIRTEYREVYDFAMEGQTVYESCWSEDSREACFATLRTSPQKGFR